MRLNGLDRWYALWLALLALLLGAPLFAGFSSVGWEAAQLAGLGAAIGCILLCGAPLRPRDSSPPKLLTLRLHSSIAWAVLLGVAVHVVGLILVDRTVFEYLRPSLPAFQLAGVAAVVLLLGMSSSAIAAVRRLLWKSHRSFQATHVSLSCLLLIALAMHVVTTDRYAGGMLRRDLYLAAVAGAALMLLRPRLTSVVDTAPQQSEGRRLADWRRRGVFGRNSTFILIVILVSVAALCALLAGAARGALREPLSRRTEPLALDFPHGKHVQVNCLTCHHNFADATGMENCVLCHKSARTDLKEGVEARFHEFCLTCHRRPNANLHGRGPVSACAECHHATLNAPP